MVNECVHSIEFLTFRFLIPLLLISNWYERPLTYISHFFFWFRERHQLKATLPNQYGMNRSASLRCFLLLFEKSKSKYWMMQILGTLLLPHTSLI